MAFIIGRAVGISRTITLLHKGATLILVNLNPIIHPIGKEIALDPMYVELVVGNITLVGDHGEAIQLKKFCKVDILRNNVGITLTELSTKAWANRGWRRI